MIEMYKKREKRRTYRHDSMCAVIVVIYPTSLGDRNVVAEIVVWKHCSQVMTEGDFEFINEEKEKESDELRTDPPESASVKSGSCVTFFCACLGAGHLAVFRIVSAHVL